MITVQFESSSSSSVHTVTVRDSGERICTCRGWRTPKKCWHITDPKVDAAIAADEGDEPSRYKPEAAMLYDGTPGSATLTKAHQAAPAVVPAPRAAGDRLFPMLASAMTKATFSDFGPAEWVLEEKYNGHRCMVRKAGAAIDAWKRPQVQKGGGKQAPATCVLPAHVVEALLAMPDGLYDGELIVPGGQHGDVASALATPSKHRTLVLVLFDLVECMGESLAKEPYSRRRTYLDVAVAHVQSALGTLFQPAVVLAEQFPLSLASVEAIWAKGGEGAILKRQRSPYQPGKRSADWIKVKQCGQATLTVTGFKAALGGPYSVIELAGTYEGKAYTTAVKSHPQDLDRLSPADVGRRVVIQFWGFTKNMDGASTFSNPSFDHFAGQGE